jgi:uncharacterized protein (TIGR02300 family)
VSKPELGTKRICGSCGAKFYDLLKTPITCPKCATVFVPPEPPKPRRGSEYARPKAAVHVPVAEPVEAASEHESEEVAGDEKEEVEADDKLDDAGLIVLDEQDDGEDVGGILGTDVKKDEGI